MKVLPLDWIAGKLVTDAPAERDGEGPTTVVTVDADVPDGVVVRYVVNWTADIGVEDVVWVLKFEPIDVVLEEL